MSRGSLEKQYLKTEQGISPYVSLSHLASPTVFETTSGQLGSTLRLQGVSVVTASNSEINEYKRLLHQAIKRLGEEFFVLVTIHRRRQTVGLPNHSDHLLLSRISEKYHHQFQHKNFYVNEIYLTILYKGITAGKIGKGLQFIDYLSRKKLKNSRVLLRESRLKSLTRAVTELEALLTTFKPHLLGSRDEQTFSELLQFFTLFFNGGKSYPLLLSSHYPIYEKAVRTKDAFVSALKTQRRYPKGRLSQYLCQHQLFFGQHIQFQGALKETKTFGDILTIKTYGEASMSLMLDPLLQLDSECIITHSFALEPKAEALKQIDRHRHKLLATQDKAHSQIDDLDDLKDQVASERIVMGYHHHTVLLLADSIKQLEHNILQAMKCFSEAGLVSVRETIGKKNAFFAQVPGNQKYISRIALITSENFVDFAALHNDATGFIHHNHLGSALTLAETPSKTPIYINLHSFGPRDDPAKGHSAWVGGNGSGKTTALMLCATELVCRYQARLYSFDRNRGQDNFFRSIGKYFILSPEHDHEIKLNPLQLADTKANRSFCYQWLTQLALDEKNDSLAADLTEQLKACVDYGFDDLDRSHRKLSNILTILPQDFPCWPELRRWVGNTKSSETSEAGEYAYLFDHAVDELSISPYMGFDMTHFLDHEPNHVLNALFMYLFYRIEQTLDGNLVSIFLDEGWQYLANPYWQKKLAKWLPTLRKANCQIHLATQSATTILNNPLRDVIQNNLASSFIFANPLAKRSVYVDGLGLTDAEFDTIQHLNPQDRYFLYKQERESAIARFNLSHMNKELLLLSSNYKNVNLADQIRREVGSDPEIWVPELIKRSRP